MSFKKRWFSVKRCSVCIFFERLLTPNNITLLVSGKNCSIAEKICLFCCSFIAEISFYRYFQCSSKYSCGTSCPLNVFILFCIAIFLMNMTVELRPNKGASVVKTGICNIRNSCLYSPPFKMQKYYSTHWGGDFFFPESRLWYKSYT